MLHPRDENKILKNVDNIDEQSYFTLFEKYIIMNLKGEKKLIEIDSTDQESIVVKRNGGYPIPGFIYTFIYKGPDAIIEIKNNQIKYTDLVPLVFCMNIDRGSFTGINLNALPPDVRLSFIGSFYDTFYDFFKNIEDLTENNKEAFNKRFITLIKSGGGQSLLKVFSRKNRSNYNFGYRKYLIEKVDRFRMVEYSEWKFIPFYEPKNAFRKLNQSDLYKLYNRSR